MNSPKNYKDKANNPYALNDKNFGSSNMMSQSSTNFRSKSLYTSEVFGNKVLYKLDTPFDEDPLEKIRRIIYASRFDFTNYFKMYEKLSNDGYVTHNQFKNMLKRMNIGITTLEIDQITAKAGMTRTRTAMISLRDFVEFLQNE